MICLILPLNRSNNNRVSKPTGIKLVKHVVLSSIFLTFEHPPPPPLPSGILILLLGRRMFYTPWNIRLHHKRLRWRFSDQSVASKFLNEISQYHYYHCYYYYCYYYYYYLFIYLFLFLLFFGFFLIPQPQNVINLF